MLFGRQLLYSTCGFIVYSLLGMFLWMRFGEVTGGDPVCKEPRRYKLKPIKTFKLAGT